MMAYCTGRLQWMEKTSKYCIDRHRLQSVPRWFRPPRSWSYITDTTTLCLAWDDGWLLERSAWYGLSETITILFRVGFSDLGFGRTGNSSEWMATAYSYEVVVLHAQEYLALDDFFTIYGSLSQISTNSCVSFTPTFRISTRSPGSGWTCFIFRS